MANNRLTKAGQRCLRCRTPVEVHCPKRPPRKKSKEKYHAWWLACPKCHMLFYCDEALVDNPQGSLFE